MSDDAEKPCQQGSKMTASNQPGDQAGNNSLQTVNQKSNDAKFPSHSPLDVARPGAFTSDRMEVRTVCKPGSNNSSGNRTEQISDYTGQNIKNFLRHAESFLLFLFPQNKADRSAFQLERFSEIVLQVSFIGKEHQFFIIHKENE